MKKPAGSDSVRQHDVDRAVQAAAVKLKFREDESEVMTEECDQLFHIRLHHRDQRAVDDTDKRQNHDPGCIVARLLRKEADIEAQQSIRAHLQQHAGEQHRSGGGRLHVRVRQPGVKREKGDLDRKRDEEAKEEQSEADSKPGTLPLRIAF